MAMIVPFPLSRYVGKARHVAAMIARRGTARQRETYYRTISTQIAKQLRSAGLPQAEVDLQIRSFTETVNRCIAEGWHFPPTQPELAEAHRLIEAGMADIFDDNKHPPGAA